MLPSLRPSRDSLRHTTRCFALDERSDYVFILVSRSFDAASSCGGRHGLSVVQ